MIARRGWEALLVTLVGLLLSFYVLNYLLLLISLVAFAFLATEIALFYLDTLALSPELFETTRRSIRGRMAVGTIGGTEVSVRYLGGAGFVAELYDVLPDGLELRSKPPRRGGWWGPGEEKHLRSEYVARVRGSYLLGPTYVRIRSRLGLAERRIALPSQAPIQVVPENPVRKPGQLHRRILTRVQGRMQLRHRGYGTEFRSLRPYMYSDDIRHVAWRRSTLKNLVVREFEQESRQDVLLVIDVSPGMLAGEAGTNVLDHACQAATMICGYAQRSGEDRLGLLTYSGKVHQFLRPARGPPHFRRLYENVGILRVRPGTFDIAPVLDAVGKRLKQGAHVLLFSAFDRPMDGFDRAYAHFRARGHHLYVFLPDLGTFYTAGPDPTFQRALSWAIEEERTRFHQVLGELRAEAIPTFPFDRRGAATKVITAYGQMRAWGSAA
jgi:uncharacterized protein (DUF58 family)